MCLDAKRVAMRVGAQFPVGQPLDLQLTQDRKRVIPSADCRLRHAQRLCGPRHALEVGDDVGFFHPMNISALMFAVNRRADVMAMHTVRMQSIGERIKALRQARRITQPALAARIGISQPALSACKKT